MIFSSDPTAQCYCSALLLSFTAQLHSSALLRDSVAMECNFMRSIAAADSLRPAIALLTLAFFGAAGVFNESLNDPFGEFCELLG